MKIGVYQFYPEWGQKEQNLLKIREAIYFHKNVDLWVLPELCTTGYQFTSKAELTALAEEFPDGETAHEIMQMTADLQNALIIGVAEKAGSDVFNSAAVFEKGNFLGTYRKIHLFYKEKNYFTPGEEIPRVFDIMGARVGVMICFDWIFPETARTLALQGAELLAHSANLVLPYCQQAMITRSIENRCFTVTANRIGSEERDGEKLVFTGMSQATDYTGVRLAQLKEDEEKVLIADMDLALANNKNITTMNHLFEDRRINLYK
ncbi:MAG: acyltransferase [Candidatus Marinimicrobia bacterium]|nr:acyltransferase [Candidatus Neomarinimicrobiota bacterium]